MNFKIVALAAVGIMLAAQASAAAASAAQVSSVSGSVLASKDGKFSPATSSTTLQAGDRLVARDGTAQVKFSDGCVVSVKPQAMLTVGASSPCATGCPRMIRLSNPVAPILRRSLRRLRRRASRAVLGVMPK